MKQDCQSANEIRYLRLKPRPLPLRYANIRGLPLNVLDRFHRYGFGRLDSIRMPCPYMTASDFYEHERISRTPWFNWA